MNAVTRRLRFAGLAARAVVMAIPVIGGCALPEPAEREAAEYRRIDRQLRAIDDYKTFQQACRDAGGIVYMKGSGGRIRPGAAALSTLTCAARPRILR